MGWLSLLIFLPLAGAGVFTLIPSGQNQFFLRSTQVMTGLMLMVSAYLWYAYSAPVNADFNSEDSFRFVEKLNWFMFHWGEYGWLSSHYYVGVDGLSLPLVFLSSLILFIGSLASSEIAQKQKAYFALYLVLGASIIGCFVALDFLLFFLFFEFMLLPMYFLIGIWGGKQREYAAIKFFIYTLIGSVLILATMIGLYSATIDTEMTAKVSGALDWQDITTKIADGRIEQKDVVRTFSIPQMSSFQSFLRGSFLDPFRALEGTNYRLLFFVLLMLGLAIKVPVVPLHTWLPDAHVQAPTPISVILAGLLLKIGTYGMFRLGYGIFPEGAYEYGWWIGLFGVISIVYAAFVALGTKQLKRMIAFSSISHMGFVLLGLASMTAEAISGGIFQMISHGMISPMLFLLAGVIYKRTHDLGIYNYSGLMHPMPIFTTFATVGFFASLGLPGFSGFIAEVMVFIGSFASEDYNGIVPRWMPIVALLSLVVTAAYYLWTLQRMFFGQFLTKEADWKEKLSDVSLQEKLLLVALGAITVLLGIQPQWLLEPILPTIEAFIEHVSTHGKPLP